MENGCLKPIYNKQTRFDTMKQFFILLTLILIGMYVPTYAQISNGVVAHYPFSGNADDAVGTINGTVSNATLIADRYGNPNSAYEFVGSGNNRSTIDLGNNFNNILSGSGKQFSLSIWFKRASTSQQMVLFAKHANSIFCGSNAQQLVLLLNDNGTLQLNYYQNGTATNYDITSSQISDTAWHHLVVTYDGSIAMGQDRTNFYVDNSLWTSVLSNNGTNVTAISGNTAHAGIGHILSATVSLCNSATYGSYGSIDDVRLYNRIVPVADVDALFVEGDTRNGLIAHYPFSGNANDVAGTVDGTVRDATLTKDRFGKPNSAYAFTSSGGNRSVIDLGNNFNATLSGNGSKFSISIWFKRANMSQKMTLFSKYANSAFCGTTAQQLALLLNANGSLQFNYYKNGTAANYDITNNQITDTDWHHLVVTYDGSLPAGQDRTNFYMDNVLWSSALSSNGTHVDGISGNAAHAAIGHVLSTTGVLCNNSTYGADGSMDDIYLYNKILSTTDINALFTVIDSTDGLAAHYPFSGNADDALGRVDGTAVNATLTQDRFGNPNSAYAFTSTGGSNNRSAIALGNNFNSILSGTDSKFSVSLWFKTASTSQRMVLFAKHSNGVCGANAQQLVLLMNTNGSLQFNYYQNTSAANYNITTNQITDTRWHHLVMTYDGSLPTGQIRTNFYIDNNLWTSTLSNNGTNVSTISGNAAHAAIGHILSTAGSLCGSNTYGSQGSIDDVYLYHKILNTVDVNRLYTPNLVIVVPTIEQAGMHVKVYPNPVQSILTLDLTTDAPIEEALEVQIINITGQVVATELLQDKITSIATHQLATGVYFIKITDGTRVIATQKIIKE